MSTILKWAGNKSRVMPELQAHLPEGKRLVEPFAGSCAVMMNTDYPAYLIADINPDLINLYQQVKDFEKPFTALVASIFAQNSSKKDYYRIRDEFNHEAGLPLIYRAAYFLYLNRHGYRGLCRYNLKGGFNAPYEKIAKPYLPINEIQTFAVKAQRATFIHADFTETLSQVKTGDVVYCDPPYIGTFTQYHAAAFDENRQRQLAQLLSDAVINGVSVVASNSDTPLAHEIYVSFERHVITAPRSIGIAAGKSKRASEIIAVRSKLTQPERIAS